MAEGHVQSSEAADTIQPVKTTYLNDYHEVHQDLKQLSLETAKAANQAEHNRIAEIERIAAQKAAEEAARIKAEQEEAARQQAAAAEAARIAAEPKVISEKMQMVATAYDPVILGSTIIPRGCVAANLQRFPRGTKLKITFSNGTSRVYPVLDTGGFAANNPNQLDIAMPNDEALQFGRQNITVEVVA